MQLLHIRGKEIGKEERSPSKKNCVNPAFFQYQTR